MNLPRGAKASGWTAGPWMELEPPNYPEGDRVAVHCDKCGAKNRQDPGWRYRDDPPHINTPQRLMASAMLMSMLRSTYGDGVRGVSQLHYQCDRCREDGKRLIYEEVEDDEEEGDDDVDELGDAEAKADEPVDAAAHAGPAAAAVSGSAAGADDVDAAQQLSAPDVEVHCELNRVLLPLLTRCCTKHRSSIPADGSCQDRRRHKACCSSVYGRGGRHRYYPEAHALSKAERQRQGQRPGCQVTSQGEDICYDWI